MICAAETRLDATILSDRCGGHSRTLGASAVRCQPSGLASGRRTACQAPDWAASGEAPYLSGAALVGLCVAAKDRLVVVRAFVTKTRRTPRREVKLALRRAGGLS